MDSYWIFPLWFSCSNLHAFHFPNSSLCWYNWQLLIVHRLLTGCIWADSIHPSLLDKTSNSLLCNNLNYRNRMAQYAGKASVALNTHLFFRSRNKTEEVEGYVLFVRKNALQILIPKYGLEVHFTYKTKALRQNSHMTKTTKLKLVLTLRLFDCTSIPPTFNTKNSCSN